MKTLAMIAILAALPLGLAGCNSKPEAPKAEAPDAMANMAMPAAAKTGTGSGTVTAVDAAAGKVTLDHGAIPAVGWPAMTMGFSAKPALLDGIKVGDKVDFELTVTANAGEVTAIRKQ